jgi:quinol monooxygenase YgiN
LANVVDRASILAPSVTLKSLVESKENSMIRVVAIVTAKPGRREDVLALFKANVPAVLEEKGCVEYTPVVDAPGIGPFQAKLGPDTFVVIETWESAEALAAHAAAPHMVAYGKAAKDLLASRTIHVLSPA